MESFQSEELSNFCLRLQTCHVGNFSYCAVEAVVEAAVAALAVLAAVLTVGSRWGVGGESVGSRWRQR